MAVTLKDNRWFHINKKDFTPNYPETYEEADDFNGPFARVREDRKWALIDPNGKVQSFIHDGTSMHWFFWIHPFVEEDGVSVSHYAGYFGKTLRLNSDHTANIIKISKSPQLI